MRYNIIREYANLNKLVLTNNGELIVKKLRKSMRKSIWPRAKIAGICVWLEIKPTDVIKYWEKFISIIKYLGYNR